MDLNEARKWLGWKRELVLTAINSGVETPIQKKNIKLIASKNGKDYDISEEDLNLFISAFDKDEPGRHPPIEIRRKLRVESRHTCSICGSHAPVKYHHMVEWSDIKHHDPKNMLAVCGTCHDKIHTGDIDFKAQQIYKEKLQGNQQPSVNVKPVNLPDNEVLDSSPYERVVLCLPRGFILLKDLSFNAAPHWCVVASYYHFGEGWRGGTHFHTSYINSWRDFKDMNIQCAKTNVPLGDREYAYSAFYLMVEFREISQVIDIKGFVKTRSSGSELLRYYAPEQPINLFEVANRFPELEGSGEIRDLIQEIKLLSEADLRHSFESVADTAFSLGHKTILLTTKFLGAAHPSMPFIQKIVQELDIGASQSEIKSWIKRLATVVSDALHHS